MKITKLLLPNIIGCTSTYTGISIGLQTNSSFVVKRNYNSFSTRNVDQNNFINEKEKSKGLKRNIKERPLTEEQKKKRKEFFLKEEEWEGMVDHHRLTDKGNTQKYKL